MSELFIKVVSNSKNEVVNTSIGFEFKNGLSFLENLDTSIKEESGHSNSLSDEDKTLILKITKDK
jgi:hypothetical protein